MKHLYKTAIRNVMSKTLTWKDIESKYPKLYKEALPMFMNPFGDGPFDGLTFIEFVNSIDPHYLQSKTSLSKQDTIELAFLFLDRPQFKSKLPDLYQQVKRTYKI